MLAIMVLVSRVLATGPVYFADGPAHVRVALARTHLVQPHGYWLFRRIVVLLLVTAWQAWTQNRNFETTPRLEKPKHSHAFLTGPLRSFTFPR